MIAKCSTVIYRRFFDSFLVSKEVSSGPFLFFPDVIRGGRRLADLQLDLEQGVQHYAFRNR